MNAGGVATEGLRIVYGIQPVRQALERQASLVERLLLQADIGPARLARLTDLLDSARCEIVRCPATELHRLAGGGKHQGVVALLRAAGPLDEAGARALLAGLTHPPLLLLLDGVQDPRNLGACLRSANAAGTDLVISGRSRTVGITPVVSKVAAGAAETQPQAHVPNLVRCMDWLRAAGIQLVGADPAAAQTLYEVDLQGPVGLVLGGEGQGLRRLTREHCDRLASLPMAGTVESLNVAVAAGVCLYEALRQRRAARVAPAVPLR